jgi:hypothetical protein
MENPVIHLIYTRPGAWNISTAAAGRFFMAKEAWMDNTHLRVTSEDGNIAYLYEVDAQGARNCTEIVERQSDGTTTSHVTARALDDLFWGSRYRS